MKKTNFLQRYYKCTYDYNLFQTYIKESTGKALLFILPFFLVMLAFNYFVTLQPKKADLKIYEIVYDHIQEITYDDVYDLPEPVEGEEATDLPKINLADKIEATYKDGLISLDQNKLYSGEFEYENYSFRVIIDTHNEREMEYMSSDKFTQDDKDKFGYKTAEIVFYINKDFVIINQDKNTVSVNLKDYKGEADSIEEMYQAIVDNYIDIPIQLAANLAVLIFVYWLYYLVAYFTSKSFAKRYKMKLAKATLRKVSLYVLQVGMYAYFVIKVIDSFTTIDLFIITPLMSMLPMYYVISKLFVQFDIYYKKEMRKARKQAKA